jgi:glycine betaine/proline transport system permease protein
MGLWPETMSTLALVATATVLALVVGIPIGILAGFSRSLDRLLEPLLDLVQTLPPYIYLLPAIALMGYGPATALVATFIVAMPPAIRLTSLGIRMTPPVFIELGQASGMTAWQMFTKIRLPFALPSIMAGVNQSLMMAFGMVVIAGIVGSGGLGETIYGAVRTLDIATSINAAIAIVIVTMVLDRLTQNAARSVKAGVE